MDVEALQKVLREKWLERQEHNAEMMRLDAEILKLQVELARVNED